MSKQAYRMSQDVAQVSSPPTSWRWAPGPLAAIAVHSNEGLWLSLDLDPSQATSGQQEWIDVKVLCVVVNNPQQLSFPGNKIPQVEFNCKYLLHKILVVSATDFCILSDYSVSLSVSCLLSLFIPAGSLFTKIPLSVPIVSCTKIAFDLPEYNRCCP